MNVMMCRSKIHKARLTRCDLNYEGSLEIDRDLLDKAGIYPYEKILVVNENNGERLETYAIPGKRGSKIFCLNGSAARKGYPGDPVTVMSFGVCTQEEAENFRPRVIILDRDNNIVREKG